MNIGIDFGGVLSIHDEKCDPLEKGDHVNTSINMPDAIETLLKLKQNGHKLYLISFCGKKRAIETKESLSKYQDLFENQFYTKDRTYKGFLCNYLKCDIMIDDRQDVLEKVSENSPFTKNILFNHPLLGWKEVFDIINDHQRIEINQSVTNVSKYCYNV